MPITDAEPVLEMTSRPHPSGFVKVEKNLASLGFFTPSSKRVRDFRQKTITFHKTVDGARIESEVEIRPSIEFGLPVTADQDKYFALQRISTGAASANYATRLHSHQPSCFAWSAAG